MANLFRSGPSRRLQLFLCLYATATCCVLAGHRKINQCSSEVARGQAAAFRGLSSGRFWSQCPSEDFLLAFHHAQRHREHEVAVNNAVVMLDIGANKGYSAAKLFNIWAPLTGFSPPALHDFYKSMEAQGVIPKFRLLIDSCGACLDCMDRETAPSHAGAPALHIYSFEPSNSTYTISNMARNHFFPPTPAATITSTEKPEDVSNPDGISKLGDEQFDVDASRPRHIWHLSQFAVGAQEGTVPWPSKCAGEGCSFDGSAFSNQEFFNMTVVTVDSIVREHELNYVDFIKIDAEGFDPDVLHGAAGTLQAHKVGMIMFEYNSGGLWKNATTLQSVVEEMYSYGYVCYMTGRPTLSRLTKCWHDDYETRHWSNVVCALEKGFASALEGMSFLGKIDLP